MNERELNLLDLIALCVRKWRVLVICTVIGLILGAAWAGVSYLTADPVAPTEDEIAATEESIAKAEEKLERAKKDLEYYENYVVESAYVNLDWTDYYVYTFQMMAITDDSALDGYDNSGVLLNADLLMQQCYAYALSSDAMEAVCPELEERFAREMVCVSYEPDRLLMKFTLYGETKQAAMERGEAMKEYLTETVLPIAEESEPEYTLELSYSTCNHMASTDLRDKQNKNDDRITELKNTIEATEIELEDLNEQLAEEKAEFSVKGLVKKAVIGAVAGFILCGVVIVCLFLFGGHIIGNREIKEWAGLAYLGNTAKSRKTIFDKLANIIAGEPAKSDRDERCALAASYVAQAMGEKKSVLLLSTAKACKGMGALKEALEDSCAVKMAGDPNYDIDALKSMQEPEAIVLCEVLDTSRSERIAAVIERAKSLDKPILGYVMV